MNSRERLQRWRYNFIPDHLIGEILTKRWTDNAIPFLALVLTVGGFGSAISGFFKPNALIESTRQLGEFSIVVIGLTIVMLAGGIDLSVVPYSPFLLFLPFLRFLFLACQPGLDFLRPLPQAWPLVR